MKNLKKLGGMTAIATLMTTTSVFADVNAQEVWGDWKAYMGSFGYDVSGAEATNGNTLSVSDVKMSMELPEGEGTVAITFAKIDFTDAGDGTVAVGLPATMPVTVDIMPRGDDPVTVKLNYDTAAFNMVVSGSANDMTYTYSAAEIAMKLVSLMADGQQIPVNAAEMSIKDVSGTSSMKIGNLRDITQMMTTGPVTYNVDFANPDNPKEFIKFQGVMAKLMFNGGGAYPTGGFDVQNMDAMLKAGMNVAGAFNYEGGNMNFEFVDGRDNVKASSQTGSGALEVAMSSDGIKYVGNATDMKMNMAGGELPFPVDMSMANGGFKLVMPVSKSDTAQDFALGVTLGKFSVSEQIWGMVDPQGQLPHDPATVAFDLSGKAKLGFDLMDPKQMEKVERGEMGMPGEIEKIDLNNLEVTIAGASLTGKGGFVIEFAKALMSQGMQGIDGALDLKLSGANALSDKLVAMGLVPQDQVMGARMMMSMFAVPAGDDVLTSKIEVKPDGQILANGQRIK
ncbi:DUF2125 domain-containing protein [Rhodobacteraceae bacterium D3-12]|nr:DUF2125 domain-containing protein [Rhodobacteraceae bacterium D3-12]